MNANLMKKTIEMSKTEAKAAGKIGSEKCKELREYMEMYPTFTIDIKASAKDQTYDRDLLAMRTYYDCGIISVGIILTRAEELNDVFSTVYQYDKSEKEWKPILSKYGASTTWMGKLLPRLDSKRNGGCPVLAIGIKKACVSDWQEGYVDEHKPGNK